MKIQALINLLENIKKEEGNILVERIQHSKNIFSSDVRVAWKKTKRGHKPVLILS